MKPPVHSAEWPEEVQALWRHDMREIWDRHIAPQVWNQYHNQFAIYLSIAGEAPLDILDVGCAQGKLALLLAERGHRVTAVDLRPDFLEYAKSRHTAGEVRFICANVLHDDLPRPYDLVFANQLLEHLVYPEQLLRRLHALLKPAGLVVATTPNGAYVKNRHPAFAELGDPRHWEHMQFTADGDGHFFAYGASELTALFRAAGFEEVRNRFFESPMISGHLKVRHVHRFVPERILRALDQAVLALPGIGPLFAHQLMVSGRALA